MNKIWRDLPNPNISPPPTNDGDLSTHREQIELHLGEHPAKVDVLVQAERVVDLFNAHTHQRVVVTMSLGELVRQNCKSHSVISYNYSGRESNVKVHISEKEFFKEK